MKTKKILFGSTLLAAAALSFCAPSANAATLTWAGTDDNSSWNYTDTNWSNGSTFSSGDNAIFDDSAESSEVYIEDEITAGTITISSGSYIFTLSDAASLSATSLTINEGTSLEITGAGTFIGSSPSSSATIEGNLTISAGETTFGGSPTFLSFVYIGYNSGSSGKLTITDGDTTFSVRVHIGQNSGASGSLTIGSVDGTGGTTKFEDTVYVGYEGTGELTIYGGETTFGANVSVGNSGTGKLTIYGGDTTFSGSYVFIGNNSGSFGTMEISGGTTKFENEVRVGDYGTGTLTITGGDVTFSSQVLLGRESGSSGSITIGSVDGTGGNTKFSNTVYVGRYGKGELTIFGGETTFSSTVYLGYYTDSSGTLTITGGETNFVGAVYVGRSGTGKLTISDDAETIFSNTVYLGQNSGSSGTMEITGGETNFVGAVNVGSSGTGELTITGGETTFSSSVSVANGSSLSLTGGTITLSSGISNSGTVTVNNDVVFVLDNLTNPGIVVEGTQLYIALISGLGSITGWESLTTSNFSLNGKIVSGRSTIDVTTPGQVIITYVNAANLVWNGTTGNNVWTETRTETNKIWTNGGSADHFYSYDNVTFGANGEKSVSISGTIEAGTITVTGSGYTFDFSDDSSVTADSLTIESAGSLEIENGTTTFGSIEIDASGSLTVSGGDVTVSGSASVTTGGSISLTNGTLTLQGPLSLDDNTLSVAGGKLVVDGTTISGRSLSETVSGEISVVNNGSLSLSDTTITSTGTISVGTGANLSLDGTIDLSSAISNSGTVTVSDSVVFVLDNLTNEDGTYTIVSGGTIKGWGDLTKSNFSLNGKGLGRSTVDVKTAGQVTINYVAAADLVWNGTSDSNVWTNDGDKIWLNDGSDDHFYSYDNVTFGADGEKSVSIVGAIEAGTITVTGSGYTFDFSGDSSVTADSLTIAEGGSLEISGTSSLAISNSATVDGTLKITGGETTFEYRVYVGYDGTGTMEIGSVDGTGGETTFEHRVYVGYDGTGTLTISSGETTFSRDVYLGYNSTSSGTLTIGSADGIGGETKFGSIAYVGYNGTGKLTITGGETTFSSYVYLGYFSGSSGTMEIGSVDGTGGETTFSSYVYLGRESGSSGTLTISGGETSFGGTVYVGNSGTGKLTITGGETTFSSYVYLGYNSGASGTIEISGGTTTFEKEVRVGNSGTGELKISGEGTTTFEGTVTVGANGSLTLTGGTITLSNAISNDGTVTVSDSVVFVLDELGTGDNTYTIISGTGTIDGWGDLTNSNFMLDGSGLSARSVVDVSEAGQVTITEAGAIDLVWKGTAGSNVWKTDGENIWEDSFGFADAFRAGDSVTFGADGEKSVTISGEIEAGSITVTGSGYTFTFSENSSLTADSLTINSGASLEITGAETFTTSSSSTIDGSLTIGSVDGADNVTTTFGSTVYVGYNGTGELTITGGETTFSSYVYLGYTSGSSGALTIGSVDGTGGETTFGRPVYVGYSEGSKGSLTIYDNVKTAFNGIVYVGFYGTGELTIGSVDGTDGETTTFGSTVYVGYLQGSTGSLTISDNVETTFKGTVSIGYGSGSLGTMEIGSVDGTGGTTTFGTRVRVGEYGTGELKISGGETTFSGYAYVGYYGTGTMEITGGETTFSSNVYLGYYDGSSGIMEISGGETNFVGAVSVGYSGTGSLTISGGDVTFSSSVTVAEGSSLSLTGGTITLSSAISNSGTVTIDTSGKNDVVFVLDSLGSGDTYTVITGDGSIYGWSDLTTSNFSLYGNILTGRSTVDVTTTAGQVTIEYVAAADLVWNGTASDNVWTETRNEVVGSENKIWKNSEEDDYFYSYDNVTFADGNDVSKSVVVSGKVEADNVTVTGSGYTFSIGEESSLTANSLTVEDTGSLKITGTEPDVSGSVTITEATISGSLEIANGTTTFGSIEIDEGGSLTVSGGDVTVSGSASVTTGGSISLTDGTLTLQGSLSLEEDSTLSVSGGKLVVDGATISGLSFSEAVSGEISVVNNGSLSLSDTTITSTGSITVGENANLSLDGTIDLSSAISNSGTVTVSDSVVFVLDSLGSGDTYTVITGDGTIDGWNDLTASNFLLDGKGLRRSTVDVTMDGQVTITYVEAANLVWNGTENNNVWTNNGKEIWTNSDTGDADMFYDKDNVTFDDTATSKSVSIVGTIEAGTVTVTDSSSYTFTFSEDSSLTADSLTINSDASLKITGSGTFTTSLSSTIDGSLTIGSVGGADNVTTTFGSTVYVGEHGTGKLTITGGETTFKGWVEIGYYNGSSGSLTITGGTTTFEGREEIGYNSGSYGSLTIYDGETNFNGDVYVGCSGNGLLTIYDGETTFSSKVYVGTNSNSSSTLTITDGKTTFNGDVRVGENGTGELKIGSVDATDVETTFSNTVHIGCQKSSSGSLTIGSVDGAGGERTTFSGDVYIGDYGKGELTIYGGTTKFGSTVRVGYRSGSSGTLTIGSADGTDGETTFSGDVYLGYESDSSGSLTITGGKTTFLGVVYVGSSGTGTMEISGVETTLNGVAIGTDGSLAISGGTVSVTGSLTSTGSITVGENANLSLDGTIDLSSAISNSGTVTVSDSVVFVLNDTLAKEGDSSTTYTLITDGGTITSWNSLTYENFSLNGDTLSHGHTTLNVSVEGSVTITTVVANLVWNGDESNSTWTNTTDNKNWLASDGYADYFANGDNVTFGATADSKSKSVTISGTITANAVTVTGSGYTFSFYDGDSSLTANTLTIGSGASLEITGEESGSFTVSSAATIDGSLTIGENVTTTFGSTVYVGESGTGSLTISGGETTFSSSVTVAAESSLSLTGGTITLSEAISNSGTVTVGENVVFVLNDALITTTGDDTTTYTLISGTSAIDGWESLTTSNFSLDGKGLGRAIVDVTVDGQVTIEYVAAAKLVWNGTNDSNVWTNNGKEIWLNDGTQDVFIEYDNVTFGSDGEKSVSIVGAIEAGTVTVTGNGYTFDFSDDSSLSATSLTINSGASLEITGTGSFTTSSSASTIDGSLTLSDNVTTKFGGIVYVGYTGECTMEIGSVDGTGGETTFSREVYLGYYTGSSGTMEITGGTTTFGEHFVHVGYNGTGTLTISGGETSFGGDVYVGNSGTGTGTIEITGGKTTFSSVCLGCGTMEISGGTTTFGDLVYVGDSGTGELTISGGKTTFEKEVYVGDSGTGELTISGGETTFKSSVTVAAGSSLSLTGGTITLSEAITNSGTVTVGENVVFVLDSLGSGGTYTIISGTGEIEGWDTLDESNFSLNGKGLGRATVDVTTDGQVTITYVAAANLVWNGTASSNVWTNDGKEIWLNNGTQDVFIEYDNVTFGSSGEKSVSIVGTIEAGTVTVTGSSYTFTFSEDSSLTANSLTIDSGASLEITNGEATMTSVDVHAGSSLAISGGTLTADRLSIYDRASLEITNGETTITYVDVFDESTLKISGGTLTADSIFIEMESSIELTGGELTVKTLYLHHGSGSFSGGILNVGEITGVTGEDSLSFGDGLTVNLYDTTSLNIDAEITLSGTVTFNAEDNETIDLRGTLSGSGKLVKDGEGTLTISGDNTFSGGATISSGTIVAESTSALGTGAVAIADGATLEIPTSREFTNATSGNGTLSITNNATVSFTKSVGVQTVEVTSGATLSGATTLTHSNAQLVLAGALVLDASAGEQVSFTNGGTVVLEDSATLTLSGISAVSPASVKPLAAGTEEIGPGSSITIFSGATIEGDIEDFLKTDSTLSDLSNDYAVVYDPDKGLTVTVLESGNASSLTSGLKLHDGIGSDFISAVIRDEDFDFGNGFIDADELNPIVRALVTGNISEASKMMDTLAPSDYAAMVAMPTTSFYNDVKAIDNRLAARRGPLDENARWEFFAQAQGTFIENDDANDTQTFDFDLYGVLAGADYRVNEGLTVGVTVGYDYGKADIHNSGGKIESDDVRITLFAGQQIGEMFFVNAGAQVGYGHYEAKRKTAYGNANGDTDGWNAGVFADVGMMLTLSEELKIAARPYVGLAYLHSEVGSFDDNIFDVDDFHGDSLRASVGCGLFWGFELAEAAWTVGLDASYSHDFCGDEVDIDATCMSTDKDFGITAKALSKDLFSVGPTVSVGLTKSIDIFAGYAFQAGTDSSTGHNLNAGLKVTF